MKQVFLFLSFLFFSPEFFSQETYSFKRKIETPPEEGYYTISLSPEIIARSYASLNDMRIFDLSKDTVEIPYIIERFGDRSEVTPVSFELLNDVTKLKCCSFVTLKMKKTRVINSIRLDIIENNFDKFLTVEGSNDGKEWFMIKDHLRIVGFDNAYSNFRSTGINFPSSEYEYFRIKFDDDGSPRINVTHAYAFDSKVIKGNYHALQIKKQHQSDNKKEKTSEVIIELNNNYPLSYMSLASNDNSDYYRSINIYRSQGIIKTEKGEKETWKIINSGVIRSDESNVFVFDNVQTSRIKLEIINNDNQPVQFDTVALFAEKTGLVTKLPESRELYLFYGSKDALAPVYDLIHFKDKIPGSLPVSGLEKEEQIRVETLAASSVPLMKNKLWLWAIMGLLIVLIGYFALNMLKKEKNN